MKYRILIILCVFPLVNIKGQKGMATDSINVVGWLNEASKQRSSTCVPLLFGE